MENLQPVVTGPDSKYAGKRYKLGRPYNVYIQSSNTNYHSWQVIEAMFELAGEIDFWDLAVACRHHKHGTQNARGPQSWVRYLIRNDYLVEAGL